MHDCSLGVLNSLQAKYINDPDVLVEAAVAAGFDADEARAVIADPTAYRSEVWRGPLFVNAPDRQ